MLFCMLEMFQNFKNHVSLLVLSVLSPRDKSVGTVKHVYHLCLDVRFSEQPFPPALKAL